MPPSKHAVLSARGAHRWLHCNPSARLELEFADGLKVMMPCPPVHFSEYGRRPYAPCGAIGEDTAEVLGGLGYSETDIAQMRESGAAK